jgi:hypothetical protein
MNIEELQAKFNKRIKKLHKRRQDPIFITPCQGGGKHGDDRILFGTIGKKLRVGVIKGAL